ncbi:hypothetical protein [Intestinimonas butyriciproducens]|uniref:hypothetical protein n=1 Tax=Intestinimonas butyriciproducens TaxID=1297617 RepID=UPI0024304B85|nr:hypothetical protein [Intestinimonas butyriciproducens]MCI6364032.1 hypothetical protein [Intestinimonas butyriciproducens]MDY3615799.1 hypothetical protein [Intestinimonas butyriciproducens]
MDALLLETAELFCPVARQKGQRLLLEVPERDLPPVTGDPQRLRQVLSVLLDNAFSYTPQGGSHAACRGGRRRSDPTGRRHRAGHLHPVPPLYF